LLLLDVICGAIGAHDALTHGSRSGPGGLGIAGTSLSGLSLTCRQGGHDEQ
jgi:hypothetical protein